MLPEHRPSNSIEREAAQKILTVDHSNQRFLMTEMKKGRSEVFKKADKIYTGMKGQTLDEFSTTDLNSQVVMLFYFFTKFDKMLTELYLNVKIIVHLTILIYLNPRFQQSTTDNSDRIILSGNLMVTFNKKYRLLVETLAANLDPALVGAFDCSNHAFLTSRSRSLAHRYKRSCMK
jgi:hypothetical protein